MQVSGLGTVAFIHHRLAGICVTSASTEALTKALLIPGNICALMGCSDADTCGSVVVGCVLHGGGRREVKWYWLGKGLRDAACDVGAAAQLCTCDQWSGYVL